MKKSLRLLNKKRLTILLSLTGLLLIGATSYLLYNNYLEEKASNAGTIPGCPSVQISCQCPNGAKKYTRSANCLAQLPDICVGIDALVKDARSQYDSYVNKDGVKCKNLPNSNKCDGLRSAYLKYEAARITCGKQTQKNIQETNTRNATARANACAIICRTTTSKITPPPTKSGSTTQSTTGANKPTSTEKKTTTTKPKTTTTTKPSSGEDAKINRWEKTDY